jgi:choline transport protein
MSQSHQMLHKELWPHLLKTDMTTGDEVKDPSRRVPQSMVLSIVINGGMALVFMIVVLFTLGDPATALATPTGYPIIQVLYGATKSKAGTTVIMVCLLWNGLVALFSALASISRLSWAFARDHGLPFPEFFGYVSSAIPQSPANANIY